jgi:protein TonB
MRRFLLISLGVHVAAALIALAVMLAPRAPDPKLAMADLPDNMTPVEVVRAPGAAASPPPAPDPAPQTPPPEPAAAPEPAPPEPEADGGAPPSPPRPEQKEAAAAAPQAPPPAPEKAEVHVDLGAAGLTDEVEGEDLVAPGPDPSAQNIPPRYPREAVIKNEHGVVELLVRVSPIGTVDDIEVVRSSGHASLDEAALKAVQRWRFTPLVEGGLARESTRVESFNFE